MPKQTPLRTTKKILKISFAKTITDPASKKLAQNAHYF